jgi:hypothetical protein
MDWLDSYEIRARIIPSIIVCLPIIVPFYLLFNNIGNPISGVIFSGMVLLGMSYTVSFFVQYMGKKIQNQLWSSWGGAPSSRILRWSDKTFDDQYKAKLHKSIKEYLDIELMDKDSEQQKPSDADLKFEIAFSQAKRIVYNTSSNDLLGKYNAEYGFHRNLMGSRIIWILSCLIGTILCGGLFYKFGSIEYVSGTIVNSFLLCFALIWGWYILPLTIAQPAEHYAITLWESFYLITQEKDKTKIKEINNP